MNWNPWFFSVEGGICSRSPRYPLQGHMLKGIDVSSYQGKVD
jgi:hypothetical protein